MINTAPVLGSRVESLRPDEVRIFEFGQEVGRCGQSSFMMTPLFGVGAGLAQAVAVLAATKTAKIALITICHAYRCLAAV